MLTEPELDAMEGLVGRLRAPSYWKSADGYSEMYDSTPTQAADALTTLIAAAREGVRLRESVDQQIQWTPGEPPRVDGIVVYGHSWSPYRWKAYSPKSEQFRRGIKGRWQEMNEFGGWENAKAPDEWASDEAIRARAALNEGEK